LIPVAALAPRTTDADTMQRIVLTFLLSLLLIGMQQESQRHALQHLQPLLTRAHEVGVHAPVDEVACAECALLAGGTDAIATGIDALPSTAPNGEGRTFAYASRAVPAPTYFESRAPPVLL
jgi:hypothetical protein